MPEELDALVRRVDEDRWLASRFAPGDVRARLIAIYALNHEIARTAETVTQEGLGAIRLAWWREALAELETSGKAPAHPAIAAYARIKSDQPSAAWIEIIEAREADLAPAPFTSWQSLDAYLERTAGGVFTLAAHACDAERAGQAAALVRSAALAWGYAGMLRAAPYWAGRGRTLLPGAESEARARGEAAFGEARQKMRGLPPAFFPAFGYLALAPAYLRGETPGLLMRQLRLVWASATGRL